MSAVDSSFERAAARRTRDYHWSILEKAAALDPEPLWVCTWNKHRRPELADEVRMCLLSGVDLCNWLGRHQDWLLLGDFDETRYAQPLRLTKAGLQALSHRELYDQEPVEGGLVEPGVSAIPFTREEMAEYERGGE